MEPSRLPQDEPASERERALAGALHDVSNAMTVVLGWLDAAAAELGPGEAREALAIAQENARLGHALARRAIGAEVRSGELLDRSVRCVARDAAQAVSIEAARRGVRIHVDDAEVDDAVVLEAASAQQVLTNLLLNAVAFSPPGGVVALSVAGDGEAVRFSVLDQGAGVPEEMRATLLTSGVSTREGGAGIGLCHSADVAAARGGALTLGSPGTSGGDGARFDLRWPASAVRSSTRHSFQSRPLLAGNAGLAGCSVLVVEDDPNIIQLLELALSGRGVSVCAARSQEELAALLGASRFDAALVDLSPIAADPGGWLGRLREVSPGLPVVMITGTALEVPGLGGERLAWVRKPFEVGEVVTALCELVEASW
ncbi:MAG: response regulator [Polyangiaceae bacterium]|nr:response regulator [Polyangiaceae bacterium]MCW5791998.1 response regulator [Polyangiaceae bacterium]